MEIFGGEELTDVDSDEDKDDPSSRRKTIHAVDREASRRQQAPEASIHGTGIAQQPSTTDAPRTPRRQQAPEADVHGESITSL